MTILQVTSAYGPRTGGIRTHLDTIRPLYAARGITAALVVPGETDQETADAAGPIFTLRSPRLVVNPDYRNIWRLGQVAAIASRLRPDAVELLDKWTLHPLAPRLERMGLPTYGFSTERLGEVLRPYLGAGPATRLLVAGWNRWYHRQFRTVVCHSAYAAADLLAAGARQVVTVPLGVDLELFRPERADPIWRQRFAPGGERLLVYAGRLVPEKGVGLLAETMTALARRGVPVRLLVAGGGSPAWEARLAATPQVTLLGFVRDRERLASLLASADAFLFSSGIETFALAVLEALAAGCPVVGVARGAVAEVVTPRAGILTAPTGGALADAVVRLLAGDQAALRVGARQVAEEYPWERTVTRLLALYQQARPT